MKNFILLAILVFTFISATAQRLNNDRKELVKAIKTNYNSWQIKESDVSKDTTEEQLVATISQASYTTSSTQSKHNFTDFSFKIGEGQAIVQFQVDFKKYSAFMEKEDGKWKLVCAAELPVE